MPSKIDRSNLSLGLETHLFQTCLFAPEIQQRGKRLYSDGTVTNWLQPTTDFFMANANIKDSTPASKYFDPSHYLKTIA
jgi:hypothetical protein